MHGVRNVGDLDFSDADDANVPVSIFLTPVDEDDEIEKGETHKLTADNFMPRKATAREGAYKAFGTQTELVEVLKEHVLPLYEIALANIHAMITHGEGDNYYWERKTNG